MDFTVSRLVLLQAIQRAANFVDKKSGTVLSSVLLEASGDAIRYTATDNTVTVLGSFPATVKAPGGVALDAGYLLNTLKSLSGDVVSCTLLANARMEIRCGVSTFKLIGHPAADFPVAPADDEGKVMHIPAADFARMLDQTMFSVAPDDNRYGLCGVHFEASGGADQKLRIVTTDGNRMSWSQAPFTGDLGVSKKSLVPRRGLAEIRKMLDGNKAEVEIVFDDRRVVVRLDDCTVIARLLEADFPDYRQVIPEKFKRRVTVDVSELQNALKRVLIFANDSTRTVKFVLAASEVTITSRTMDAGESRDVVACEMTGEPITMGFNGRFVQDVLGVAGTDRVTIEIGDVLSPCVVKGVDATDALFVVMPVRIE